MQDGTYIGIDFGTTNTSVVCVKVNGQDVRSFNIGENGEYPFSSIVALPKSGGKILFGRDVKEQRQELSKNYEILTSMKSWLGTDKEFIGHKQKYTPTQITASYLKYLKDYISTVHHIEIEAATFAFPVDFSPSARRELKKAAQAAGIRVNGFVSESTAAYIANKNNAKAYSKVMVVDWGGGTIDISILDLKHNCIYESSVYGDSIGGDDIDLELAKRLHSRLVTQSQVMINFDEMSPAEKDHIISRCEQLKIGFSDYFEDNEVLLRNYGPFGTRTVAVDYDYFEAIITPIIKNRILRTIDLAMARANVTRAGIDAIILVGGSCNLKTFEKAILNIFGGDKIITPEKPQWSVALGAAYIDMIGSDYYLNEDVGVVLSDESVYPILIKGQSKVGSEIAPITFSLTEDAPNAQFIFSNSDKSINYGSTCIKTKGFLQEKLELSATIDQDQIAVLKIANPYMGNNYAEKLEINKLKFYYDLSEIKEL